MNIGGRVTKRIDGRYEARYEKGRNPDGSIKYGFCYGKTQEEAEWKRQDAMLLLSNANISPISFASLLEKYVKSTPEADGSPELLKKVFEQSELAFKPICELKSRDIYELLIEFKNSKKNEKVIELFGAFQAFFDYACKNGYISVSPTEKSEQLNQYIEKMKTKTKSKAAIAEGEYLSPEETVRFEQELCKKPNEKKIGLFVALKMGLSFSEIAPLQIKDVDLVNKKLRISKKLVGRKTADIPVRILCMPDVVSDYFSGISLLYEQDDYVIKQGKRLGTVSILASELSRLNSTCGFEAGFDGEKLRATFAVNKLLQGVDIVDLAGYMGESVEAMLERYAPFVHSDINSVINYELDRTSEMKGKMNLLILGAGDFGHTVKEIAEDIGIFDNIDFLDDDIGKNGTIGICADYSSFRNRYNVALPAFGDNKLRRDYVSKLVAAGYIVPKLIHPLATVSQFACIDNGVIVEANATVNANTTVGVGSLICSSSLVDKGVTVEPYCHIDSNATVVKDSVVRSFTHVKSGVVFSEK